MTVGDIFNCIHEIAPFDFQEEWDNSGLIVGSFNQSIDKIYLSIDIDLELANSCEPNSLIITHHPLIFSPIKSLNVDTFPANIINILLQKNISLISAHTNYDKFILNRFVLENVLEISEYEINGFICQFEVDKSFDEFLQFVKKKFCLSYLKYVKTKNHIKKVALTTGSGASFISKLSEIDLFLTGDIKYHDGFLAKQKNISLIDIGHFESELFFAKSLVPYLQNLDIQVIISNSKNPFNYN